MHQKTLVIYLSQLKEQYKWKVEVLYIVEPDMPRQSRISKGALNALGPPTQGLH